MEHGKNFDYGTIKNHTKWGTSRLMARLNEKDRELTSTGKRVDLSAPTKAYLGGEFLTNPKANIRLLASGATLNFAIEAERELKKYNVIAEIWSITSFNELYKDAIEIDRNNRLEIKKSISYVEKCFSKEMPTIAVSEYIRAHPNQIREWVNGEYIVLGTDGFGRSDTRSKLRDYFEISKNHIVLNALNSLKMKKESKKYVEANNIKLDKKAPWLK